MIESLRESGGSSGHTLEGRVVSHILPIFHGECGNGKSTPVDAVMAAFGDYADAADADLLTARTFDAHPTGIADLCGLRLAVLHETDAGRRLAEGTVKRLTGGDRLKARRMREDFWSFDPSHTFVMLTNHRPIVGGTDEGIWRRLRLVPWVVVIPDADRDEELPAKLARELEAVLAWLVADCRGWHEDGLREPEQVTTATATYRQESDALGRFVNQRCLVGPHFHVGSTELFTAWSKWCAEEGEDPGTQTAFASALQNTKGFDKRKAHGAMRWTGIGLAMETNRLIGISESEISCRRSETRLVRGPMGWVEVLRTQVSGVKGHGSRRRTQETGAGRRPRGRLGRAIRAG